MLLLLLVQGPRFEKNWVKGVEPRSSQGHEDSGSHGIRAHSWLAEGGGGAHWRLVLRELLEHRPWPQRQKRLGSAEGPAGLPREASLPGNHMPLIRRNVFKKAETKYLKCT